MSRHDQDHNFGSARPRLRRRMRTRISRNYFRVMPNDPRWRSAIWVVFWLAAAVILLQLMYPPTRAVPTARLNQSAKGWRSETELAAQISQLFDNSSVQLQLNGQALEVPLKQLGAQPETAAMIQQLTNYPFWQRYVPLSLLLQPASVDTAVVTFTNAITGEQCRQLAAQLSRPPVNARIELVDGRLEAGDEQSGWRVDAKTLCRDIQTAPLELGRQTAINVQAQPLSPQRTSHDLAAVRSQAERALSSSISFTYGDQTYQPTSKQIATWLQLGEQSGETILNIDKARVEDYLAGLNQAIGRPAGVTDVKIVNGSEVSRRTGRPGQQVNSQPAVRAVAAQLLGDSPVQPVELELVEVAPIITYNSRYTANQAGLQAYVNDAARDYNARIMLRQLNSGGWVVAARETESIPSASTYKVYVATWLFKQMEQGKISWNTPILDTNTSVCFDRMTIASTNACAEEWLVQVGRANMNQFMYGLGASHGTTFTSPIATHTTAADLTDHMTKIARGELYDDIYRQRLFKSLATHPYRYGIPVGSRGQVYDKVGFLWDYVHDTAIVKHPRGDYVLTIMTKGQSYARIASIAREIERIMYP